MWIVIILGLAGAEPTFRGPYQTPAECHHRADNVNAHYGAMVHAKCITAAEAARIGWQPK